MNAEGEKNDVRRPMNGFLIFCNKYRGSIQKSNPSMDNRNVTKALGDLWANLGDGKKAYMNIAQQQKDAFMMANPGYRWHKEKSQNVTRRSGVKPSQAHGSKTRMNPCDRTVEEQPSTSGLGKHRMDGARDRFKNQPFTEPGVSGHVVVREQAKYEKQSLSASFMPLETSTPVSVKPELAVASPHKRPESMFSALLQVAEMFRRELEQQFTFVQPSPRLHSSTQADSTLLQPSPDRVRGCRRPKPPPKKRAWSLTETGDGLANVSMMSCCGDDVSKQLCSDISYINMEACNMILPRRKFSTTTESPSTLCSFTTESEESPVFFQTWTESEHSTQKSDSCDTYVRSPPAYDLNSNSRTPQSTLKNEPQKYQHPPLPDTSLFEMPRKLFVHESDIVSAEHCHSPYKNYFQQHPEPGMSDKKFGYKCTENLAPGSPSTHIVDNYSPYLKFDPTREKHPTEKPSLNELKPKNCIFPALSPDEKPFSAPPSPYTRTTLASLLSKGRLVSLLSSNVAVDRPALPVSDVHHSAHKTLQKIENIVPTCDKQSYNKQTDSHKQGEQFLVAHKSNYVNEKSFVHGRPDHLTEPESAVLHLPLSHAQNFSEGKLKKKWEKRMLVEAKQETIGRCQVAVRHDSKDAIIELARASQKHVTLQDTSLLCVHDSEQTDRSKMHRKQGRSVLPVEQKPIFIQPQISPDAKSSQATSLSSSNSSRYSKLRQQLSQNQPLLKPDLPRLQSSFNIQPEQEASDRSYLSHSSLNSGHQQCMDSPNKTKAGRDTDKLPTEIPSDRKGLDHVATYGKRFMDHILEQFSVDKKIVREDICEDRQTAKTDSPGLKEFPCDRNSSVPIVKSENEPKHEPVLAGLKEVSVDRFQKDLVDYKMLTASSLVEKVVREFCDSSQRKDACDSTSKTETGTQSDDHATDASHMTTEPDSLSNQTLIQISSAVLGSSGKNGQQVSACANGEDSVQCQLTPVAVGSSTNIADTTIIQPIRQSLRANRGQKYQELIKEGIIQPSRERLASKNGEKLCKNHGTKEVCSKVETRKVKSTAAPSDVPVDGCAASSSPSTDSYVEELSISRNAEVCMADPPLPGWTLGLRKRTSGHSENDGDNSVPQPHCDDNHYTGYMKGSINSRKISRRHRSAPSQSNDENSLPHPRCRNNHSARLKGSKKSRMTTQCHRSAPSQLHSDNSCNQIPAVFTPLPALKAAVIGSESPTGYSSLPRRDQVGEQISGSQKRKARRHCIMRISADHEANEDLDTSSPIERSTLPPKKPHLSSESHLLPVSSSSLNTTMSLLQLTDSVSDIKGEVVSVETSMPPDLRSMQSSCDQNKMEVTDITEMSFTVHSWQEADVSAQSSSDVGVGTGIHSCTSFIPMVNSTPIVSCTPVMISTPMMSSLSIMNSTPIMSSTVIPSSTPVLNSLSITSSTSNMSISSSITSIAPIASSTPIISSASIVSSASMQSLMPVAGSTPMILSKREATAAEFTIPSNLNKMEQEKPTSPAGELPNKKLQNCAQETTVKEPRQGLSETEISQSCTKNTGSLEVRFDEDTKVPVCDSPFHPHLDVVNVSNCVESKNKEDEDTSLMSHVKSILECTYSHTESSPAMTLAPRRTSLNVSSQSRPFYEAKNISLYTALCQDDSTQSCCDTTVMDVSSTTALLASHSASSLPVIEICESMHSPALENSSSVKQVTFTTKSDLTEALSIPPNTVSMCHNCPSSSRFTLTASGIQVDRPSSSAICSVANKLSSAYSSSSSNTVISLASPIVNFAVNGSSPILDNVSTNMIGSPHLPESPSVAVVRS